MMKVELLRDGAKGLEEVYLKDGNSLTKRTSGLNSCL